MYMFTLENIIIIQSRSFILKIKYILIIFPVSPVNWSPTKGRYFQLLSVKHMKALSPLCYKTDMDLWSC